VTDQIFQKPEAAPFEEKAPTGGIEKFVQDLLPRLTLQDRIAEQPRTGDLPYT